MSFLSAQVRGTIQDMDGTVLPYTTIYIENTSIGVISNVDGQYELNIDSSGSYVIHFQYVGYKLEKRQINYNGIPITLDIKLLNQAVQSQEVTITANREDPAYAIMRKAIANKKIYREQVKTSESDIYAKGVVKITDAPSKVLGEDIGNLNGILDTARQGIVYLSESRSKFYFRYPEDTKEVMVSTITSGSNNLFTANQFSWSSFDLYKDYLQFSRSIVSPLSDNAFDHYDFRLERVIVDDNGILLNKIKIIPKSKTAPLLNGYLYISDDLWNLHTTDIRLYGTPLKNTFLDTIAIKQVYVPIDKKNTWRLFSQVIDFKAGLFGFKMGGSFSYIFSNYKIDQPLDHIFNSDEKFKIEKSAMQKDTAFWNEARPIPLTLEEKRDYIKKDSLSHIWNSKVYLDSVDKVENKFNPLDVFRGYTWNNSYKNTSFSIPSPLSSVRFNAVEGFKLSLNTQWVKTDSMERRILINPIIEYGLADKILKPRVSASYRFSNYSSSEVRLSFGRQNEQFDPQQPISERGNTWSSLWSKNNNIDVYQVTFVKAGITSEVSNGLYMGFDAEYLERSPVGINSQFSFRYKSALFKDNIPRPDLPSSVYDENTYLKFKFNFIYRHNQKYSSYPNSKFTYPSLWPALIANYEAGLAMDENSSSFNKLIFKIRDRYVNAKLLGYFSYNIEYGTFIGAKPTYFGDYLHPMGNQLRTPIDPDLSSFNLLPYYSFSTTRYYTQANFRHHFDGYIMDKIPLLNRTSLKFVAGINLLYGPPSGEYGEAVIGIENFKIGPITLFGIDYTWAFDQFGYRDRGWVIKLSSLFNN